jgi:hypothetical protein
MEPTANEIVMLRLIFSSTEELETWIKTLAKPREGYRRLAVLIAALILCTGKKFDFFRGEYPLWLDELFGSARFADRKQALNHLVRASRDHCLHRQGEHQHVVLVIPPELRALLQDATINEVASTAFQTLKQRAEARYDKYVLRTRNHSNARHQIRRNAVLRPVAEDVLTAYNAVDDLLAFFRTFARAISHHDQPYYIGCDLIRSNMVPSVAEALLGSYNDWATLRDAFDAFDRIFTRHPIF